MTFSEFIEKVNRRQIRNSFPSYFLKFQNELLTLNLNVKEKSKSVILYLYKEDTLSKKISLNAYLDSILGINIQQINDRIIFHFENENHFLEGLPLFVIRRHGSYSGEAGSIRRRRGWLVKFNNAWIVYADNFFSRHFFESAYFVDSGISAEISSLNLKLKMPYSSGGGKYEKRHRIFPALTHITSRSTMYLSHLYDLNQGSYNILGSEIQAQSILGDSNDNKFGYGCIEDWDNGKKMYGDKNYRIMNIELTKEELVFLKSYNVRMLSPFNYFPFPKNQYLTAGSMNGESLILRRYVNEYFEIKFKESFNKFRETAGVKN